MTLRAYPFLVYLYIARIVFKSEKTTCYVHVKPSLSITVSDPDPV